MAAMNEQLLTSEEVADLLKVSVASLYQMRYHRQAPPAVRIGGRLRWQPSVVLSWLDDQREPEFV